jgi:hypothetical protein
MFSGHVLSKTAGVFRASEELNCSPEQDLPQGISGFARAASIDGERPDYWRLHGFRRCLVRTL